MDALGLQCAEKATMIVVLRWLAGEGGGGGLSEERLRWWLWAEKRSSKAARVMQEAAVSWEARERKVPLPLPPAVLEAFLFVGGRGKRPGSRSETKLLHLRVIGESLGRVQANDYQGRTTTRAQLRFLNYQQNRMAYGGEGALSGDSCQRWALYCLLGLGVIRACAVQMEQRL
jgi:hypothetical protein